MQGRGGERRPWHRQLLPQQSGEGLVPASTSLLPLAFACQRGGDGVSAASFPASHLTGVGLFLTLTLHAFNRAGWKH